VVGVTAGGEVGGGAVGGGEVGGGEVGATVTAEVDVVEVTSGGGVRARCDPEPQPATSAPVAIAKLTGQTTLGRDNDLGIP